jgi:cytoskeletal protein CcmA (bactofilin family)
MWGCWASRRTAAALLLALPFVIASPAAAKHPREHTTNPQDVKVTQKVRIDGRTISITTSSNDSDSTDVTVRGNVEVGPIVVHGADDGTGIVRLFSDAEVGAGERVAGDVVAVFGSLRVDGEITGSAVAVFGTVDLGPTALVRGDAVAVGGGLREAPGARVTGQTVQVGFLPLTLGLPGLPVVLGCITIAWLISLFFGWVAAALFPGRVARVAITSSRRTTASLALGVVSGPLMLVTMLLLMVTVVGIPIAIFLPVAYIAVVYMGQIAATYVLGCKLTRRRLGEGNIAGPLMAGSLLVASVFGFGAILWETPGVVRTAALFFLLVGVLLLVGLACIGTGAFLLSRAGNRPRDLGLPATGDSPLNAGTPTPSTTAS